MFISSISESWRAQADRAVGLTGRSHVQGGLAWNYVSKCICVYELWTWVIAHLLEDVKLNDCLGAGNKGQFNCSNHKRCASACGACWW